MIVVSAIPGVRLEPASCEHKDLDSSSVSSIRLVEVTRYYRDQQGRYANFNCRLVSIRWRPRTFKALPLFDYGLMSEPETGRQEAYSAYNPVCGRPLVAPPLVARHSCIKVVDVGDTMDDFVLLVMCLMFCPRISSQSSEEAIVMVHTALPLRSTTTQP